MQHCREFDILGTLRKLNPSELEITYLFAQICFEHAGKRNQGDIMKVTEQFLDSLANDLHDYYVNEMNNSRYFLRLTQLLKINQAIQVCEKIKMKLRKRKKIRKASGRADQKWSLDEFSMF